MLIQCLALIQDLGRTVNPWKPPLFEACSARKLSQPGFAIKTIYKID